MPREYDLRLQGKYDIGRNRYRELKAFCLQYDEKKRKLKQLYSLSAVPPEVSVMGGEPGKPTEKKALKAIQLKADVELIEKCLQAAIGDDVGLLEPLKKNITLGIGFDSLGYVPCSVRPFYRCRKKFFYLLDKEKN